MNKTVLITGARSVCALDLARDMALSGYAVYMADSNFSFVSRFSSIPRKVYRYASPRLHYAQFCKDIQKIIEAVRPSIIIPTCEEVFYLAQAGVKENFSALLFAPSFETLHDLHDKGRFAERCAMMGIPVPETHRLLSPADVTAYQKNCRDWVFKPCFSRFGSKAVISPSEERLAMIAPDESISWVAQKRITGQEMSFYAVARSGELVAFAPYTSSWRLRGGASYAFTPVLSPLSEKIKKIAEVMAEKFKINGQFSCDLIVDRCGDVWLIECNPRATSGLHFLTGGGRMAQVFLEDRPESIQIENGERYLLPVMLTYGITNAVKCGRWRAWISTLKSGSDVIGAGKDRWPFVGTLIDTICYMLCTRRRKISMEQATTYDIEWNGETLQ